jgi:hypothetical protein
MPHPASRIHRDRALALQATLLVKPAHKRQSLVLRSSLVIDTLVIKPFDSEKSFDLFARKTGVREILNLCQGWDLFS